MRIALVGISYNPAHREELQALFDALYAIKADIYIFSKFYRQIKDDIRCSGEVHLFSEYRQIHDHIDFFFSMGGDGTLLRTVQIVRDSGIPILGINTGRLGYLTSATLSDIRAGLILLREGNYQIEKRSLLRLDTKEALFGDTNYALNDFTIHKKDSASMIIVHAQVNGVFLNSYWGDGLIVSTPTGSTAY
ncbi:MAG: NAD(+)/NADH kinase, partial [Spirochaetota bacterium]